MDDEQAHVPINFLLTEEDAVVITIDGQFEFLIAQNPDDLYRYADSIHESIINIKKEHKVTKIGIWAFIFLNDFENVEFEYVGELGEE